VILADAAQVVGGKLYVLGGAWNAFRANAFPTPATMAFVVSILVDRAEAAKDHSFSLTLADSAGVAVLPPIEGRFQVGKPEGASQDPQRTVLALNSGVLLVRPGRYTITVVAGSEQSSIFFDALFTGKKVEINPGTGGVTH